jgi:hypothetical protein
MRNFIIIFTVAALMATLAIAMGGVRPAAETYAPAIGGHQSLQPVW